MNVRYAAIAVAATAVLVAGGYGLYELGHDRGMQATQTVTQAAPPASTSPDVQNPAEREGSTGKRVLYWHDPMVPGQRFDKPGKSPFMDMPLVPVYADSTDAGGVTISPRMQQNLGVRTAEVVQGTLASSVEAVGSVAYNERDVALVQSRANGFVERLHVRAPLDPVRKGQPLIEIYVPDWVAAQEEYLTAKRIGMQPGIGSLRNLIDAARERMRLAGMNDEQIRLVESSGNVQRRLTLNAPIGGIVGELNAREGMTIMTGAPLFRINGLSTVWVNAELPENVAAQVRPGTAIEARSGAVPGEVFKGKVNAILPEVNPATRTIKARIELANPGAHLVPGMFATIRLTPSARDSVLLVPSEAVMQTGRRNVVMVAQPDGRFASVDVEVGADSNGQTEIRKGLQAGQKVVVSGQFLVDSEASLKASAGRMDEPGPAQKIPAPAPSQHGDGHDATRGGAKP